MKNYEILSIDSHQYLVIALSVENVSTYLQSLRDDLSRIEGDVRELYVDLLMRNGLSNRFFKVYVHHHVFDDDSITRCKVPQKVSDLSDSFFSRHSQYISKSIMPSYQKAEYIEKISKML